MLILGINDSSHDASVSLVDNGTILFAGHSERYNKQKNSSTIDSLLMDEALAFGKPDIVAYFEKRNKKRLRRAIYGGLNGSYQDLYKKRHKALDSLPEVQVSHHKSHAYAGFLTSPYESACIVVVDAIGEFQTASIWHGQGNNIRQVYSMTYPLSFGLFYSAFTRLVGLTPGQDEYILMGLSAYGDYRHYHKDIDCIFPSFSKQTVNLHTGVEHVFSKPQSFQEQADIAAAVQHVFTKRMIEFNLFAQALVNEPNLVLMGGCALNCSTNSHLLDMWRSIWIMPNPGDAGSSLGAALGVTKSRCEDFSPYLGHNLGNEYPVDEVVSELLNTGIVGVASGRAEFGPRALGNRSLLADPRPTHGKSVVNKIKNREDFRPFAPVVMEEHASEWFEMDKPSPYMQFTFKCRKPHLIPSVVHVDGTSRVQTVNEQQNLGLYCVLKKWHMATGIPVLLNTSLNIKNQPIVNDICDIIKWKADNPGVKIFS